MGAFDEYLSGKPAKGGAFDDYLSNVEKRSWSEAASDLAVSAASGAGALVEGAGAIGGLISGNMDNPVREAGKGAREYWNEKKSPGLQAREQGRRQAIDSADGEWSKAWAAVRETATDPALFSGLLAEQLPMMVPGMAIGRGAGVAAGMIGASEKVTRGTALGAAIGTGATLQGGDVGSSTFDRIAALPQEMFDANPGYQALLQSGIDPAEARKAVALDESRAAAAKGAGISLATMLVPGGTTVERLLVGAGMKQTGARAVVMGMFGEAAQEGIEEGGGQFAQNVGVRHVNPAQPLEEGVGDSNGNGTATIRDKRRRLEPGRVAMPVDLGFDAGEDLVPDARFHAISPGKQ